MLAVVGGGNHDSAGVDFGNAEVATEMDEIKRAKIACDLDHVHRLRSANKDVDVVDVCASEVQP